MSESAKSGKMVNVRQLKSPFLDCSHAKGVLVNCVFFWIEKHTHFVSFQTSSYSIWFSTVKAKLILFFSIICSLERANISLGMSITVKHLRLELQFFEMLTYLK